MKVKKALGVAGGVVVVGAVVCGGLYYAQNGTTGEPVPAEEISQDPFTAEPLPDTLPPAETETEEVNESEAHETDTLTAGAIDSAGTVGG